MKPLHWKRLWATVVAVFATIFVTDWVIHGWMLSSTYQETAHLWRPQAEMMSFMPWMMAGQFLVGFFLCWIFAKGFENKGWMEGARYGALIGSFGVSHFFITYAVSPYPFSLFMAWVISGWVQAVVCGIVASAVYGWAGGPKWVHAHAKAH